jgi:aryl-alcohol dehydrogenase-like predicted oxidoreductase
MPKTAEQRVLNPTRRQALAFSVSFALTPAAASVAAAEAVQPPPGPIMTRPIPSSAERLPVVGLGTDEYSAGGSAQQAALDKVVKTLVVGRGSVVDTSSDYGASEGLIAAVLADGGLRQSVFLATKLERDALTQAGIDGSLRRLGVGKIDLLQVHNVSNPQQSLAPLHDWKAQGLVRYIGITTSVTYAHEAIEAVMRREKPDFVELNYSLGDRDAEHRLLPAATELGIATLIDIPFGGPGGSNLLGAVRGKELPDWAHEFDAGSWGQFFLKYVLANPAVTCAIPGTRNPEHMADNLAAARGRLPDTKQRQRMVQFFDTL